MAERRRFQRIVVALIVLVVGVPIAAAAILAATFDPNAYKPRIEAAVLRATGRRLTLAGPIALSFAPDPVLVAREVSLANPAGFPGPDMLRIRTVRARLALLPLLHGGLVLNSLALDRPDLLLETDQAGRPNWRFAPERAPAGNVPAEHSGASSRTRLGLRDLVVAHGTLTWRDGRTGRQTALGLDHVALTDTPAAGARLDAQLTHDGAPFSLSATSGAAERFGAGSWPVHLALAGQGATLHADGTIDAAARPVRYDLALRATIPNLAALRPQFPHANLPQLGPLDAAAHIATGTNGRAALDRLAVKLGAGPVPGVPGLALTALSLAASTADAPLRLDAAGTWRGAPVTLAGTAGTLAGYAAHAPVALSLDASGWGARLHIGGSVAPGLAPGGLALSLDAKVPDLSALSSLAGRKLPAIRDLSLHTALADPQGLAAGLALRGMQIASAQGDLAGDLALSAAPRPSLAGSLVSSRLDFDGIGAAPPVPAPAASTASSPSPPSPPPAPPAAPAGPPRLIPDTPLPFAALRRIDLDLTLRAAALIAGGVTYHDASAHLLLQDGALRLDPFSLQAPGGAVVASLSADAGQTVPPVALTLRAPSLDLRWLLGGLGLPPLATGALGVDADLRGRGASPHAIAGTLSGHLGLSLVNGTVNDAALQVLLGGVLRGANLPLELRGTSALRCLALRADLADGRGTLPALALDATRLRLQGGGAFDLGRETLALHLRPSVLLGAESVAAPVSVGGSFLAPSVRLDRAGGRVGISIGGSGADVCEPALAVARGGMQGAPPAAAPRPKAPNAAELLRGLGLMR